MQKIEPEQGSIVHVNIEIRTITLEKALQLNFTETTSLSLKSEGRLSSQRRSQSLQKSEMKEESLQQSKINTESYLLSQGERLVLSIEDIPDLPPLICNISEPSIEEFNIKNELNDEFVSSSVQRSLSSIKVDEEEVKKDKLSLQISEGQIEENLVGYQHLIKNQMISKKQDRKDLYHQKHKKSPKMKKDEDFFESYLKQKQRKNPKVPLFFEDMYPDSEQKSLNLIPQKFQHSNQSSAHNISEQTNLKYKIIRKPIKQKKEDKLRKARTSITISKLTLLNKYFKQYKIGASKYICLKDIARKMNLGYSTVLHKYREFKTTGQITTGELIGSLQQKRKYNKSLEIQQYIKTSLAEKIFYTVIQLQQYIQDKYGKLYSRSIINRHLNTLGYLYSSKKPNQRKNKRDTFQQYITRLKQNHGVGKSDIDLSDLITIRKKYSGLMLKLMENKKGLVIYIDQMVLDSQQIMKKKNVSKSQMYNKNNDVSIMVAMTSQKVIHYQIKKGENFTCQSFAEFVEECINIIKHEMDKQRHILRSYEHIIIVTNMNSINYNNQIENTKQKNQQLKKYEALQKVKRKYNIGHIYLPPHSQEINPFKILFKDFQRVLKNIVDRFDWTQQSNNINSVEQLIKSGLDDIRQEYVHFYFSMVKKQLKAIREQHYTLEKKHYQYVKTGQKKKIGQKKEIGTCFQDFMSEFLCFE